MLSGPRDLKAGIRTLTGIIFDIKEFSIHDGPGGRTTVFMKGCPLRCRWCHNPESQHTYPEILFHKVRCIGCGTCDAVCPQSSCHLLEQNNETFNGKVHQLLSSHQNRKQYCTDCSLCAESCPTQALELCGKSMSSSQVLEEVMKDEAYYRLSSIEESDKSVTCGGVTLSGGEPLMQFDFTLEISKIYDWFNRQIPHFENGRIAHKRDCFPSCNPI